MNASYSMYSWDSNLDLADTLYVVKWGFPSLRLLRSHRLPAMSRTFQTVHLGMQIHWSLAPEAFPHLTTTCTLTRLAAAPGCSHIGFDSLNYRNEHTMMFNTQLFNNPTVRRNAMRRITPTKKTGRSAYLSVGERAQLLHTQPGSSLGNRTLLLPLHDVGMTPSCCQCQACHRTSAVLNHAHTFLPCGQSVP